ncbi:MAG: chromosome partitioning protein, partial [Actinomycetota bacterium]|nr:chromosome partitioning protein [Actinomycetota bacterium]
MTVHVVTAVTGAPWEAALVASLERGQSRVEVVRRCVDLADLLATAAAGTVDAVLLSADLRRLDRDALARLEAADVAVVGLFPAEDEDAERRLRQLGIQHVLPADVAAEQIASVVTDAVAARRSAASGWSHAAAGTGDPDAAAAETAAH